MIKKISELAIDFKKICDERTEWPVTLAPYAIQEIEDLKKWTDRSEKKENYSHSINDNIYTGLYFDSLFDHLIKSDQKEFWYIGSKEIIVEFFEHYNNNPWKIQGLYQLDYCFYKVRLRGNENSISTNNLFLFHITKKQTKKIEIGFSCKTIDNIIAYLDDSNDDNILQKYINKNIKKKYQIEDHPIIKDEDEDINFEIVSVPSENFYFKYFDLLKRYDRNIKNNYDLPKDGEKIGPLKDFVKFINPIFIQEGDLYIVKNKGIFGGFYLDLFTGKKKLRNADGKVFITEGEETGFIEFIEENEIDYVCRCSNEDFAQYIYSFINNRKNTIIKDFEKIGGYHPFGSDIEDIPIFIPNKFTEYIDSETKKLFNPIVLKNKLTKYKKVKDIVDRDLTELQICFDKGAYKATLILAGAILEAFLIDWLSEEDEKDYYYDEIPYKDLNAYIIEIKKKYTMKKPPWKAWMAKEIKDKRNLIHAKKWFFTQAEINEKTCLNILDYLKYIINYRYTYGKNGTKPAQ